MFLDGYRFQSGGFFCNCSVMSSYPLGSMCVCVILCGMLF